jgi:aquaporin Z
MKQLLTEAIGTFFLVLTVGLCVNQNVALAPVAIGAALMVMVYAGGHISGGHYNPAVTFAAWLRGALPAGRVVPYWGAQFVGGIAAAFLAYHFTGHALHVAPASQATWLMALGGEFLFTFALAYMVLNVATAQQTQGNSYFGLAIGSTVMIGAFAMGGISGGAFNPAVGLAPAIVELLVGASPTGLAWIYLAGPIAGGAAAAYVFKAQHPGE